MSEISSNNRRIAKNTLFLYFRMLLTMAVSLYTSRVVLNALGIEDYGIYNVVGGVVAMFTVISGSLSASISRFITYELGKGNNEKLNKIFSVSVIIQVILSLIVVVFIESIGVWFLNTQMTIPDSRIIASNWVLQFSIITFVLNLVSVPYNAAIIAHERMVAFAYISILEVLGQLLIALLIVYSPIDKLVFYALLMCFVGVIVRITYGIYCKRNFEECTFRWSWDKNIFQAMFDFAAWNFIGTISAVLRDQGGNIIINLFCGPAVNAARGISVQVNSAITAFVRNFMTALNPQITKSYASGDKEYMMNLIFQGARFSFYLLLFLSLPVIINTHYILMLWLENVPEHTVTFVQLTLIFAMSESISNPLMTAMFATGRIRNYQIVVGGIQMLNLPIAYVCLKLGALPESILIVAIIISQCCFVARLYMLRSMVGLSFTKFLREVYLNVVVVAIVSAIIPFLLSQIFSESFFSCVILILVAFLSAFLTIFYLGCNKKERLFAKGKMMKIGENIKSKIK